MNVGEINRKAGFTLIELLVTIAMIAIIATIAVPNFQSLMARNQLSTDFNQILTSMHYARSEAAKRREPVSVMITTTNGWELIVTHSGQELRKISSQGGDVSVTSGDLSVTFNAFGWSDCPVAIPCSVSVQHSYYSGSPESLEINSVGKVTRIDT
ncbi:GspH/FimT family pseudopilin [Halomonas daqiaonensis]|uniref:GspH/FimT family pseudopilin n=1 Tax=Halomonas daqiaonensis TaxID=650850 RepID=UPI000B7D0275|nr:GspH/FimT family pseudopilin [Halomonas daqiaonensis]